MALITSDCVPVRECQRAESKAAEAEERAEAGLAEAAADGQREVERALAAVRAELQAEFDERLAELDRQLGEA